MQAKKDSSSLEGLATTNLTVLQQVYGQHKMDLFFVLLVEGGHRGGVAVMGRLGGELDQDV